MRDPRRWLVTLKAPAPPGDSPSASLAEIVAESWLPPAVQEEQQSLLPEPEVE